MLANVSVSNSGGNSGKNDKRDKYKNKNKKLLTKRPFGAADG